MENLQYINLQKLLRTERQKRFMTYEDVANGLGCSSSYVFRLEKGKRKKPSYEFVSKMINFFEVDDLSVYIDSPELGKSIKERQEKEQRLLEFMETMDCNSMAQINELLQMIEEYRQ